MGNLWVVSPPLGTTLNQEMVLSHNLQKQLQLHKALASNVDFTESVLDK